MKLVMGAHRISRPRPLGIGYGTTPPESISQSISRLLQPVEVQLCRFALLAMPSQHFCVRLPTTCMYK